MRTLPNDRLVEADITEVETGPDGPVRRCILSGERAGQDELVRLALSPDGVLFPDVLGKAPGRGAWLGATRAELEAAIAKGRIKGALARAFKGAKADVPPELPEMIAAQLKKAFMDRLGLESRAGNIVIGSERIDQAARSGVVTMLLHASDGGEDGRRKLDQAWRVGREAEGSGLQGIVLPVDRNALSMALGRQNAVHVALVDSRAATRVKRHLGRWLGYCGISERAASGASAPPLDVVANATAAEDESEG